VQEAPILKEILELGLNPAELINTYRNLALYPEVEVIRENHKRPDFDKEKKLLQDYLARSWKVLPRAVPAKGWDGLQKIIRQARLRTRHLDLNQDRDFLNILSGMNKSGPITQYKWPTKEIAKEQKEEFDTFREDIIVTCLERWHYYCHYFIMELVLPAIAFFNEVRKKSSLMNFHDLLLGAAELLRNNPEVRGYFQERFTHILVDEFQDTDPIQAEVILYLTGEELEEKSWRKLKVKPGALFIVGDPKQSIYRFRRADIDTYNEVKKIIEDSGGTLIPLTTNFRSLAAVCEWINPIFKEKFPVEGTQHQPSFERLEPFKILSGGGVKRISIGKVPRNNQKEIAGQDAERIASFIGWALMGNLDISRTEEEIKKGETTKAGPGDFMILLRYKAHLPIYARALEALNIPYQISGGAAFKESVELRQLINLLAAVAEPEDQIALVATLRGHFFGISDNLIYRFRKQGGTFSFLISQDGCSDVEARQRIEPIFSELKQFYHWARTRPPAAVLSMIMDHLGIIPMALSREIGESRAGNLLKAIEIAFGESSRGLISFSEMVERLENYYTELDVEEMSVDPCKKNTVQVMNLHKAKGLEATVVFLADPMKETAHDPDLHIRRSGDKAAGYVVASRQAGEYQREIVGLPPEWEKYAKLEREYQGAEEDRLLYVAATRAKQLLIVSRYPDKSDKGSWKELYPYLETVEELEIEKLAPSAVPAGTITAEDFEAGKGQIAAQISISKQRSYEVETVTGISKASTAEVPFPGDTGRGMSWGRIIHKMLEALAREKSVDLELLAENLLKEEERLISEKELVVTTVRSVMSSELWRRMKKAEEALVEVPFSLKIESGELPKIVSGAIDLAFKEPGGWIIADYKTDKVDGNLDDLVAYYKPQVEMYREFWKEMSGQGVKEAGLYFVDAEKWVCL
jgi:ATP-dependent helicase/nuclease subunit A